MTPGVLAYTLGRQNPLGGVGVGGWPGGDQAEFRMLVTADGADHRLLDVSSWSPWQRARQEM